MYRSIAALFALACVVFATGAHADDAPRPVRVQTATFTAEQASVTYPGTVQARVQANLGFRVSGKVTDRFVEIGELVVPGQRLARLDPTDARLSLEASGQAVRAAEAEAVNARADFHRYQGLGRKSPAWLPSEFDRRQATLDGAEARLAQAQRQLALAQSQVDYVTLIADAAGVITDLKLEVGQVVTAGQTVLTLAHTQETDVVVDVPENRLPDIRTAQAIQIRLWSRPDLLMTGRVREVGALADPVSRTFAVKVTVLDPPEDTPGLGMTATVRFIHDTGGKVALLPASAVIAVAGAPSVWVLDPNTHRATSRPVTVAAWLGDGQVAITGGIEAGAKVVTAGAAQLDASVPLVAWAGAMR